MTSEIVFTSSRRGSAFAFVNGRNRPSQNIRRPQVAKHHPRLSDGIKHPVVVRMKEK